jgi:aspartoacylase
MGLSIVVDTEDKLTWEIIAYLKQNIKELKVFRWKGDEEDVAFLNSISKSGFAIEVGPIPQGVITADMFFGTELIIQKILDFFELYNTKNLPIYSKDIEIYDHIKLVDYPRDENNNILAMVHSSLQGKGYVKLEKNSPLFITFDGKTINYEENEEVYALFINEAAYYEKGFAMCLTNKITVSIKDNMA